MHFRQGFTLIELLIVVAIIAILAAIAVPNFLEAQTRAKVSRVKSDQRTLDTGLNAYMVDNNRFPQDVHGRAQSLNAIPPDTLKYYMVYHALVPLTTPVAYLTTVGFGDPFGEQAEPDGVFSWESIYSYQYYESSNAFSWGSLARNVVNTEVPNMAILVSQGPDQALSQGEWAFIEQANPLNYVGQAYIYDPTNGTVSSGDIVRGVGGFSGSEPPNPGGE